MHGGFLNSYGAAHEERARASAPLLDPVRRLADLLAVDDLMDSFGRAVELIPQGVPRAARKEDDIAGLESQRLAR